MKNTSSRLAIILTVIAAAMLLASGPALRLGWVGFVPALLMFAASALVALVAALVAGIAWLRTRPNAAAAIGFFVAAIIAAVPISQIARSRGKPPIHDISTDLADPPLFSAVLPLRASTPNKIRPFDEKRVQAQKSGYPDLVTLELPMKADAVFAKALDAAKSRGWEIVSARPADGIIEATDTTAWFGFKDDVVVRVRAAGDRSRVDVRSTSRVGRGDSGKNADRIREYLRTLSQGR